MLSYYPPIKPFAQHHLQVDDVHEIYIEQCGIPDGLPVLYVHGGPGGGCTEDDRRFFDPNTYHIILFDQRGCGHSRPHGELTNNTTHHLIEDMEQIREFLNIDQWVLAGGSWGTTLSLAYAERHPDKVLGLILRSIFLGEDHNINWLFGGNGANLVFPDFWQDFIQLLDRDERQNPIQNYYKKLTGDDEIASMHAAKSWSMWEAACSTLKPNDHVVEKMTDPYTASSLANLECYYFMNRCFLEPGELIANAKALENIPGIIIHGRYDMVSLLDNAWRLYQHWQGSELHIIREAGHAAIEPGILDAVIRAGQSMAHHKLYNE